MAKQTKQEVDQGKRGFLLAATTGMGVVATAAVATPFVCSMLPSERAKAAGAPVEVDVSKIQPGTMMTVEWRGKPVWVVNMTAEMSASLKKHESELSDPALEVTSQQPEYCKNETRSIKPELMVMVGICTHLGCSPTPQLHEGKLESFFCPCHGSKFDLAGRVFKGSPAPLNLEIPPHKYLSDNTLLVGDDSNGDA